MIFDLIAGAVTVALQAAGLSGTTHKQRMEMRKKNEELRAAQAELAALDNTDSKQDGKVNE